jgi:DNA polymerase-3 subunit delta
MAKSAPTLHALDYLAHPEKFPARPVCVVFGGEHFLKLEALDRIRREVLGDEDGEFSYRSFIGDEIEEPRLVFDELSTVALFGGGRRLVVINEADPFVTKNRAVLEDYVANPKPTGVLLLDVKTWATNTKLYKAVAATGLQIECKEPEAAAAMKWLTHRAKQHHCVDIEPAAVERLLDILGPDLGRLDQELAKLSLLAALTARPPSTPHSEFRTPHSAITSDLVDANVGGWQVHQIWSLVDAACEGNTAEALVLLDRLVASGEHPVALLGMLASRLRPLAAAARVVEDDEAAGRRADLRSALIRAGVRNYPTAIDPSERSLKQLGRRRAGQLYGWLLDADLAMKGTNSSGDGPRLVLEQLIVRLGKQQARVTA